MKYDWESREDIERLISDIWEYLPPDISMVGIGLYNRETGEGAFINDDESELSPEMDVIAADARRDIKADVDRIYTSCCDKVFTRRDSPKVK